MEAKRNCGINVSLSQLLEGAGKFYYANPEFCIWQLFSPYVLKVILTINLESEFY